VKRLLPLSLALLAAVLMTACSTNRATRFGMGEDGEPIQFRRYTNRPAVDYIFRWDKRAFERVLSPIDDQLSEDKTQVLERHGQPDYIREGVKATRNEVFDEWAYYDRGVICQFIQGQLVYEGPLLDSDVALIDYGYPSKAYSQEYEEGALREIWLYEDLFSIRQRILSFSDGKLVYKANF